MKIAICAQQNDIESAIDSRFGRTAFFGIYDEAAKKWEFIPNRQNLQASQGAGIQAAQQILEADVDVLLACNVGPKAMAALSVNEVQVFEAAPGKTLQQSLHDYQSGKLSALRKANVEGHWV